MKISTKETPEHPAEPSFIITYDQLAAVEIVVLKFQYNVAGWQCKPMKTFNIVLTLSPTRPVRAHPQSLSIINDTKSDNEMISDLGGYKCGSLIVN
jgi:hypothetical protein